MSWLALKSACGQVATTCRCPVGHRLYGWVNGSHTGADPGFVERGGGGGTASAKPC